MPSYLPSGVKLGLIIARSFHAGVLEANGVEMIGAKPEAIKRRDRELFKQAMLKIGLDCVPFLSIPWKKLRHTLMNWETFPLFYDLLSLWWTGEGLPTTV